VKVLGAARKNASEKNSPSSSPSQFVKSKSDGSIKKLKSKKMKFGSLNQIVKTATHMNTNGKYHYLYVSHSNAVHPIRLLCGDNDHYVSIIHHNQQTTR